MFWALFFSAGMKTMVGLISVSPLPFSPSLCNPCFFSSPGSVSPSLPPASPTRRPLFFFPSQFSSSSVRLYFFSLSPVFFSAFSPVFFFSMLLLVLLLESEDEDDGDGWGCLFG